MKDMKYIDVHSHLNLDAFKDDWQEALKRAHEAGVGCITVGVDVSSSKKALEITRSKEGGVWATVGIHPNNSGSVEEQEFKRIEELARDPKVVAIGECGLDYFRSGEALWGRQREVLEAHIAIAKKVGKPLMLHVRSGESRNAYTDVLEILKGHGGITGDVHFFAGASDEAGAFFDLGFTVSFTGVLTFASDYDSVVKGAPLDMLHAETDSPFVAPVPHRGKRSEPAYVVEVVKRIAELRDEPFETVTTQLRENARRVFCI